MEGAHDPVLMLSALAVCLTGMTGPQQPVFRGAGDAVQIFATVIDRDARLVATLTWSDSKCATTASRSPSCSTTARSRYA